MTQFPIDDLRRELAQSETRLESLEEERGRLRTRIAGLQEELASSLVVARSMPKSRPRETDPGMTSKAKIALFRSSCPTHSCRRLNPVAPQRLVAFSSRHHN